jgi:hypothetical protein
MIVKEELAESDQPLAPGYEPEIPRWYRVVAAAIGLALLLLPLAYLLRYSLDPSHFVSPAALGLGQLILAGTFILLAAITPWRSLGLRLRKVGIFEFDRVIRTQASEHAEELTEIRERLNELEYTARGMDGTSGIADHLEDLDLRPLLVKFLTEYRPRAFSPLRIQRRGSLQPGYAKLGTSSVGAIRRVLQRLVSEGSVTTGLSNLGNTLYRISE